MRGLRPGFDDGLAALQDWFDGPPLENELNLPVGGLLERLVEDPVDRALIEAAIFPLLGADASETSALGLREEIRSHGCDIHLTLAPETLRCTRGFGTLAREMADSLPVGVLRLQSAVKEVIDAAEGYEVRGFGFAERASLVLLAVPVAVLHAISLPSSLPKLDEAACCAMNAGRVVKYWARIAGDLPTTRFAIGTPLRLLYTWEAPDGNFVSAQALAKDVAGRSAEDLFVEAYPSNAVLRAGAQDWPADRFAGASWMAAGMGRSATDLFSRPFDGIRAIGGDVSSSWAGWMEGALISAEDAAREILAPLR